MKNKLLIVDDMISTLKLYKDLLSKDFDVTTESDPAKAIELCKINQFDAILSDINMPIMTGFDLIKATKKIYKSSIPNFLITAETESEYMNRSFSLGVQDFLTKYMSGDEVLTRIKRGIKSYTESRNELKSKQVGNLSLNLLNFTVTVNETPIDITLTEYKILFFLLDNYGPETYTERDEIKDFVWPQVSCLDNTVTTHISNLKKKLIKWNHEITTKRFKGFYLKPRMVSV